LSDYDKAWALDRATGAILWELLLREPEDIVALNDGSIAVPREGKVVRIDGANGQEIEVLLNQEAKTMAVSGSWLVTTDIDGHLRGMNVATRQTWTNTGLASRTDGFEATFAFGNGVIFGCGAGTLNAIDVASGKGLWWVAVGGYCEVQMVGSTPVARLSSLNPGFEDGVTPYDPYPDENDFGEEEDVIPGAEEGNIGAILDGAANRAPRVTIRGRLMDSDRDSGLAIRSLRINNQAVRVDSRGRFRTTVRGAPRVAIQAVIDSDESVHALDPRKQRSVKISRETFGNGDSCSMYGAIVAR
jgi:hypothetical protein